jgi:cold-inducible RNA-binding protein
MPSKLYVGNLAYSVTNDDLEALFSQVGKVASAAVVSDKFSGQSRGFGFVEIGELRRRDQGDFGVRWQGSQGT